MSEFTKFTNEQLVYINNNKLENTKLNACAGSGKTRCIIFRMNYNNYILQ